MVVLWQLPTLLFAKVRINNNINQENVMGLIDQDMIDELNLLLKFPASSLMQGLKIHHDASQSVVHAAERLYSKGVITQPDGGYLTDLGVDLAEHARHVQSALSMKLN